MFRRHLIVVLVLSLVIQALGFFGWGVRPVQAAYDPALQPAQIASGSGYTLFVSVDGTVKVSGTDTYYGSLGLGSGSTSTNAPTPIPNLINVRQVAAYGNSSYALLQDGTVKSWGQNNYGQLGFGSTTGISTPSLISTNWLSNVKQIAAGYGFAIALMQDGTLKGWGSNSTGELLGAAASTYPVTLPGISNVKQIATGDKFVVALMEDGTVKTWGANQFGLWCYKMSRQLF